jgi:phosphoglycolate phosphatase-like HAD superfamily hydrolase
VRPRVAFFDFDGTLGLIRAGWMQVMIRQSLDALRATGTSETEAELRPMVEEFIFRLTGKPTICQMQELAAAVSQRDGTALEPEEYKRIFLEHLRETSEERVRDVLKGDRPDIHLVPGARAVLEDLHARGLQLYLVSGTDDALVQDEVRLFDIGRYFNGGVYGSPSDQSNFSKRELLHKVLKEGVAAGAEVLTFGDGFVEIEAAKEVGGVAVGLATLEPECLEIDHWKRERLIASGADYIIPNYLCYPELKPLLFR